MEQNFREPLQDEEHERIAQRAYEIYLARGGADGLAEEDWRQAEVELQAQSPQIPAEGSPSTPAMS